MLVLFTACAVTLLIAVGTGTLTYLFTSNMGIVSQRLAFSLRTQLFAHLQRLSLRFHDGNRLGDTMTRLTSDINDIRMLVAQSMMGFFSNAFLMFAMFMMMFWLNWRFTLVACSVSPLLFLSVWWYTRRIKLTSRIARASDGELASLAQETLSSIRIVQGLAQEMQQDERFHRQGNHSLRQYLSRVSQQARIAPIVDIFAAVGMVLVMWYGATGVVKGSFTTGDVIVFFAYVTNFYSPIRAMSRQSSAFSNAMAGAERVTELFANTSDIVDSPEAILAPALSGEIDFHNILFEYEHGRPVLEGLSLRIHAGEHVAIVGDTGVGKSTLASLVLRLYDPTSGMVLIDGHDIRRFTLASLRSQIGIVLQDSFLLSGTILENITFGCPGASREEVIAAAITADADEFIRQMPRGYASRVSERGASLSGGQKQRIAIARAVLRDAPILIMDEPTSSLDNESEAIVLEALRRVAVGRTTIMITHRLTAARLADRVVVLERGRIAEQGTPAEVLSGGSRFAQRAVTRVMQPKKA
ncbi:MAG: ABC transporter ATP-binding protein [Pirellulaceae bacterium]